MRINLERYQLFPFNEMMGGYVFWLNGKTYMMLGRDTDQVLNPQPPDNCWAVIELGTGRPRWVNKDGEAELLEGGFFEKGTEECDFPERNFEPEDDENEDEDEDEDAGDPDVEHF